jgi:hypothetical protein
MYGVKVLLATTMKLSKAFLFGFSLVRGKMEYKVWRGEGGPKRNLCRLSFADEPDLVVWYKHKLKSSTQVRPALISESC